MYKHHYAKPLMSDESIQCSWYKYFIELLDEIKCVNCIKVNVKKSSEKRKHLDYYCLECREIRKYTKY